MKKTRKIIELFLDDAPNIIQDYNFTEDDFSKCEIEFIFYESASTRTPFVIDGSVMSIVYENPNGIGGNDKLEIVDSNRALVSLGEWAIDTSGNVKAMVQGVDAEGRLSFGEFKFKVKKDLGPLNIEDSEKFLLLTKLVSQISTIVSDETQRIENERLRVEAEEYRKKDYESLKKIMIDENNAANLQNQINKLNAKHINLLDYGTMGLNDWTTAFENAFKNAPCNVFVPKGTFNFKYIRIPSNCGLIGTGKSTILNAIKNNDSTNLISNFDYATTGNENIIIKDLLVRGNKLESTPANGFCSGITMANVRNAIIENVRVEDASLHCFDAMADRPYQLLNPNYTNNALYNINKRSKFIYFINCEGIGAGDDTFTCHYSDYIYFINCRAFENKSDLANSDNRNGFEVDDGCSNVLIENCYATKGARGYEVKAHNHSYAPENVIIENCIAEECIVGFQTRHLNNHLENEPISNGNNVVINNCTCINPLAKVGVAIDSQAMQISAYRNVTINNFTAIGKEDSISTSRSVVATQYKARNITFNNLTIKGFKASEDFVCFGGSQKSDYITINGLILETKSNRGVICGTSLESFILNNANLKGSDIQGQTGIITYIPNAKLTNINITNFPVKAIYNGVEKKLFTNNALLWSGSAYTSNTTLTLSDSLDLYDYLIFDVSFAGSESKIINFKNTTTGYIRGMNLGNSLNPSLASLVEMKLTKVNGTTLRLDFNYILNVLNNTFTENNSNYSINKIYGVCLYG